MTGLSLAVRAWWRRPWAKLVVICLALLTFIAFLAFVNLSLPGVMSQLWRAPVVDSVVLAIIGLSIWAAAKTWSLPPSGRQKFLRSAEFGIIGTIVLLSTVYVAYASFRNQARMASEANLNDEAMILYQFELEHPELRCLYDNYGHQIYQRCLEQIVSNPDNWSRAIFYIEEAWYVVTVSKDDEREWGSSYSDSIEFWRQDIGKDPTGLFSYYLVATEGTDARARMVAAGVRIEDLCGNYARVWNALARHSAQPPRRQPCQ